MNRYGLLYENQNKLDYVLALTVENFLEIRLQALVFKSGMAKSIHHARVLIRQRHIRVAKQLVNIPPFMVRGDSAKHIGFALTSPMGGGPRGRVKRKYFNPKKRLKLVMRKMRNRVLLLLHILNFAKLSICFKAISLLLLDDVLFWPNQLWISYYVQCYDHVS